MHFLILLFAHLLADYPLQGQFLATAKGSNPIALFSHAGIWTGTVLTAAYLCGYPITSWDVFSLFAIHALVDYSKANRLGFFKKLNPLGAGLAVDQGIHILQILSFLYTKHY